MSRRQSPGQTAPSRAGWGDYPTAAELPGASGGTSTDLIRTGDHATVLGRKYVCTNPANGSATWVAYATKAEVDAAQAAAEAAQADADAAQADATSALEEDWVEVTGETTIAALLEDIAGCSFTLTITQGGFIKAEIKLATSTSGGSPAVGGWAASINGVDGTEWPRQLSGTNDNGLGCAAAVSAELAAGAYVVKGRHRRTSGASTVNTDIAVLKAWYSVTG